MEKEPLDFLSYYPDLNQIGDAGLKKKVMDVLQEIWLASKWNDWGDVPTSLEIPYPNLPHTQCVVELALSIASAFERHHGVMVNRDYLIAASVLQDASKLVEMEPGADGTTVKTEIGRWLPHATWCAHLCMEHDVPSEITHVVMTHSPGAPQFPKTLEGKILYYADQLDVIAIYKDRWIKTLTITK